MEQLWSIHCQNLIKSVRIWRELLSRVNCPVFWIALYKHTYCNVHCVSKNDTDVAHYNFNAHQPFLVIFGRDVAERVCYQMVICCPTSPN